MVCPQQSFIESNVQANNITQIHLAKNRQMINGLVDALKSINNITYNVNLAINSLTCVRKFSILNQLQIGLRKLEHDILIIYNYLN